MNPRPWYVYIIQNDQGRLYTGISVDPERRFNQHLGILKGGAKFFRSGAPNKLLFVQQFPNRSEASKFEAAVKKMSRPRKLRLIEEGKL
jgi:putative endonuclease